MESGRHSFIIVGIIILFGSCGLPVLADSNYHDGINTLEEYILVNKSYNRKIPPELMRNKIEVRFNLMALNDIDIKAQTMTTTGYIVLTWFDSRFDWISELPKMSWIRSMYLTSEYVWTPTTVVKNAVDKIEILGSKYIPVQINFDGRMSWSLPGVFATSCSIDVSTYPAEVQTCAIEVTTWGYTSEELILEPNKRGAIKMDFFEENGQWEFLSYESEEAYVNREEEEFKSMIFKFRFKRRRMYYLLTTILPVSLLSFLCCFVFKLPSDAGEKISYSLTVLLAYAVYLSMIADEIPETSLTTSIFSVYLVGIFAVGVLSVLLTIYVLSCHHAPPEEPVPGYVQKIYPVLARIFCWHKTACCTRNSNAVADVNEQPPFSSQKNLTNIADEELPETKSPPSWHDVASLMDRVCLYSMLFIVSVFNFTELYVFVIKYTA